MGDSRRIFWVGVGFTLLGGSLWGFSGTSVQYLTTQAAAPPSLITMMRVLFGGIIFFIFLALRDRSVVCRMVKDRKTVRNLFLFGFALSANQLCYANTVQLTNAGTATVLQMLGSVFIMLYVCVRTDKLPRLREFIGLVLAIAATMFIATQGDIRSLNMPVEGLIWGILAGLSTAVYILVPKYTCLFEEYGAIPSVGIGMLFSTAFAIPAFILQGGTMGTVVSVLSGFGLFEWVIFIVGLVIVGTIGGYGFYLNGVSMVGAVKGSLLGAIEPVSATALAALWLGTAFTGYDIVGMVLMCFMIAFVTSDEKRDEELSHMENGDQL